MIDETFLFKKIAKTNKPVLLYGTGNGADKIIDLCIQNNITISDIFASKEFVRDRLFRGFKVKTYEECISKYGNDIIVLICFGSNLKDVMDNFYKCVSKHETYLPFVSMFDDIIFDSIYLNKNIDEITEVKNILSDKRSKRLYENILKYRISGNIDYLTDTQNFDVSLNEFFSNKTIYTVIDGGAYNGDTLKLFINSFNSLKKVYCLEPDKNSFKKLIQTTNEINNSDLAIVNINAAISDITGKELYISKGNRGSKKRTNEKDNKKSNTVNSIAIDDIDENIKYDLIKLDIEGEERKAILGSEKTFRKYSPNLAISIYHMTDDIFKIPLLIHKLLPDHNLYIRRAPSLPDWDTVLFAVRKTKKIK